MKKISISFLIIFLILFTVIIKNSTKRIDDEIFVKKENIRILKKDLGKIKLEHEFLSSSEKLLEFQNLYFDDQLIKKNIQEIKIIYENLGKIEIKKLELINE